MPHNDYDDATVEDEYGTDTEDTTDDEYFLVIDRRSRKEVGVPPEVTDLFMPIVGAAAIGLYVAYCRISSLQNIPEKGVGSVRYMARACRMGKTTVAKATEKLVACGLLAIEKADSWERSRHITNHIAVLDPPMKPAKEVLEHLGPKDYEPMCAWLYEATPPKKRVPIQVRGRKSAYPDGYAVAKARTYSGTRNRESAYLNRYAKTPTLTHTHSDSPEEESILDIDTNEYEYESVAVMTTDVDQFRMNLLAALQSRGWLGGGWTWDEKSLAAITENISYLTPDAIEYAIEQWYTKKGRREPFSPVFSLNWLIKVCKTHTGDTDAKYQRNGKPQRNQREGDYVHRVAELLDTPRTVEEDFADGWPVIPGSKFERECRLRGLL